MLTYKDSLRQRLYSDSFEEGLRFGIKYFAKAKLTWKDLQGATFKLGTGANAQVVDVHKALGMNLTPEMLVEAANRKGTIRGVGNVFTIKGDKGFNALQNNDVYSKLIAANGGKGFGGSYSAYETAWNKGATTTGKGKKAVTTNSTMGDKLSEKEFKEMMEKQHALEQEYANQYFGGRSGKGGSGNKTSEEGGVWNWIKENPGKTAAIGGGALVTGLGARALLKGRDDRDDRYYR